jgi:hypothetical protein
MAEIASRFGVSKGAVSKALWRESQKSDAPLPSPLESAPAETLDPLAERAAKRDEERKKQLNERMLSELEESRARQRFLDELGRHHDTPSIVAREKTSGLREATALVLASDWHYEETVTAEQTAGRNRYNLHIAERRIGRFFDGIGWLVGFHRQAFTIRDLVLWLGGDMITGYIHDELKESNGASPLEALHRLHALIAAGIRQLLEDRELVRIVVVCSHGNHGRTTIKRQISTGAKNSFEWLMYATLAREFATEPRVHFEVTQSAHQYAQVYGETIHFHHGDDINYQGGVGGIAVPLMRQLSRWDEVRPSRLHCVGHFHQRRSFRRALVNGSLIGLSAYGMKFGFEPPEQSFALLDSKRWLCCETPIWVDDGAEGGDES